MSAEQVYKKLWEIDGFLAMAYKDAYFTGSAYSTEKTLSLASLRLGRRFTSIGQLESYLS